MSRGREVVGRTVAPPPWAETRDGGTARDAGMVIVEAAIAIPLLAAVAICLAWSLSLASTSFALGDAARQAARDIARGVDADAAVDAATGTAPDTQISVDAGGDPVVVVAHRTVTLPVPILEGISVDLVQRVAVPREWS